MTAEVSHRFARRCPPTRRPTEPGAAAACHRLHELGARARSLRHSHLSHGGDRAGGDLRPHLCVADRARDRVLRRLRAVLAAGGLARRPLEPPQHDGRLLCRLRPVADRRGTGAVAGRLGDRAVHARRVRGDLSSGRHRDDFGKRHPARPHHGVQRRLRQSRRLARRRHHRGADRGLHLARRLPGAGVGLRPDRRDLFLARSRR